MGPSKKIKRMHAAAVRGNINISLKEFARELIEKGGDDAIDARQWLLNKGPTREQEAKADRLSRKGGTIEAQRSATKAAKRKRSGKAEK